MNRVHEDKLEAGGKKVAIVAGRFNDAVTRRLVDGAIDCFVKHGVDSGAVDVYWVPGSFEIPQMAWKLSGEHRLDGIVCLGAIIRGETNHFDILSESVIRSIAEIPAMGNLPVTYGIITAESFKQAMNRAGGKNGNKGWDGALALIELMSLWGGERRRGQEA